MADSCNLSEDPSRDLSQFLRSMLSEYDGKATTYLGEAEAALSGEDGYLDALVSLRGEEEGHIAGGASWLLKSALEKGRALSEGQIEALAARLPEITGWAAQLHICQSVRLLTVSADSAKRLADWLAGLLNHQRPFLRAWSLDALGVLAEAHSEHGQAFNAALALAHEDEAASVRARARNLKAL